NRRTMESMVYAGVFDSLGYTRKALIQSMDMAFQHAQREQADRQSGQSSLFAAVESSGPTTEPIPRGDGVAEYDSTDVLKYEKEMLGFYMSGHPLKKFERTLKHIRSVAIENLPRMANGAKVEIAGVILDYSIRLTRSGKEMCRLVIEDMTGSVEAIIFPAAYERIQKDVCKDVPLFISGTLEKKEDTGTPQLIVNGLKQLNHEVLEEKQERSLHLKLTPELDQDALQRLQTTLLGFRGNLSLYFHLDSGGASVNGGKVIRAHDSFRVNYTRELMERLMKVNQVDGVYLAIGDRILKQFDRRVSGRVGAR
ncbi:MAG: DNA polymerase III subunit alpha, partial [Leptospiraceae bacterium]|nr:DNA polymerase III subunit alpha [Leptospiraceae bacterium]